jgi:hypothetical protein
MPVDSHSSTIVVIWASVSEQGVSQQDSAVTQRHAQGQPYLGHNFSLYASLFAQAFTATVITVLADHITRTAIAETRTDTRGHKCHYRRHAAPTNTAETRTK